jgi:hypothetical protein
MSNRALDVWLARTDDELVDTLAGELRRHVAKLERAGGFYAYAVLSLSGDEHRLQYLDAAYNRETDLKAEHTDKVDYRLSPDEWAHYGLAAYPKSTRLLAARNAEFSRLHRKKKPDDFMLDEFQKTHISHLHRSILRSMKVLRAEGLLGGQKSFAILWAPDSPDDILFCSAKALNTRSTFNAFWREFGDEFTRMDCDRFK